MAQFVPRFNQATKAMNFPIRHLHKLKVRYLKPLPLKLQCVSEMIFQKPYTVT
jgi:hypothetical protein